MYDFLSSLEQKGIFKLQKGCKIIQKQSIWLVCFIPKPASQTRL